MEDTADSRNTVIVVVANGQEEKKVVVDCLAEGGSWEIYMTKAGARVLTHTFGAQVVDTLPLQNVQGRSPTAIASRWISQNSLRRIIFGKRVFVVCVITDAIVKERCNAVVFSNNTNCWLDVLGLIWGNHYDIMTVVVTESDGSSTMSQQQLENYLRIHNIWSKSVLFFSNVRTEASVGTLVESIRTMYPTFCISSEQTTFERGDSSSWCGIRGQSGKDRFGAFNSQKVLGRERSGPWSPERVVLFGKTGSGKSTLAQMLTVGKLDQNDSKFKASSRVRGSTEKIETGEGRGWYVVDTPGFGEPDSKGSTIPTRVAQQKVKNFVEWKQGSYSHFLYVTKKDRIDSLDASLWKYFKRLFARERISLHWSIVISNADQEWLQVNISHLRESFQGCHSFLTAEFPPNNEDDKEVEVEYEKMRTTSLRDLEEELSSLGRFDMPCDFGKKSRMTILNERDRGLNDEKVDANFAVLVDILEALGYLGENPFVSGFGLGFLSFFTSIDRVFYRLTRVMKKDPIDDSIDSG